MSNEEIIQLLREGPSEKIGAEKLRGLLKIMPYSDEVNVNYIHSSGVNIKWLFFFDMNFFDQSSLMLR